MRNHHFNFISKFCRPRTFLTRIALLSYLVIASFGSFLYVISIIPNNGISSKTRIQTFFSPSSGSPSAESQPPGDWGNAPKRLIVFGDSWSDNGKYPVDPPTKDQAPDQDPGRGKVWTEWLCDVVSCNHHDNFARSLSHPEERGYRGAVVDFDILNTTLVKILKVNNTAVDSGEPAEPLADFKTQVQQWLDFEKQQYGTERVKDVERRGTVFAIWFSLWDLWYYSGAELADAKAAVTKTMDTLFEQLQLIAENWPRDLKVIIPFAIDMTFLPGWQEKRIGIWGPDHLAENQRCAIQLAKQWNRLLTARASQWEKGEVHIYNTFDWLLDQVRDQQLVAQEMADANGLGVETPWNNVFSGCIDNVDYNSGVCAEPEKYLFWDDMHLGPEAMRMIGEDIAADIGSHRGGSWFSRELGVTA